MPDPLAQQERLVRIAHIRQNFLHKTTTDLTRRFGLIGIEDLNVRRLMANGRRSRASSDIGFYEFRRQWDFIIGWKPPLAEDRPI